MLMKDKQNITIQLAELPRIPLAVKPEEEELTRKAEKLVNDLWLRWRRVFANEASQMVMARVAFQYALLYLKKEQEQQELKKLDSELASLLHNLPGLESPAD